MLKTTGEILLFFFVLGNITADVNKFGYLAVLFPDRVYIHLIISFFTVGHQPGLDFTDLVLVAHHLLERTISFPAVTGMTYFVIHLVAFSADHVFTGIAHLGQKGFIGIDNLHVRCDYQDKILNPVDNRLHLIRALAQFSFFQTDCLPEDFKDIVGEQSDTGRARAQHFVENFLLRRQHDDQVDAVAPVVKPAAIPEGQQPELISQFDSRTVGVGIGDRQNRGVDPFLLIDRGGFFEDFPAEFPAPHQSDVGDGRCLFDHVLILCENQFV